jgi:hypothetical protein
VKNERVDDDLDELRRLLASKDAATREDAIRALGRIGRERRDQETAELLLRHADAAKRRAETEDALAALKTLTPPRPLPPEPLLRLARRREWQVWHEAVQLLHFSTPDEVEAALLERLGEDRYGLVYVARELRFMRSPETLRALDRLLGHADLDVRCVALDSLGERLGAGVVPYARRLAGGRQHQEKRWAEKWLAHFGDAHDVPFMADRARKLLSGKRQRIHDPPELSYVVPFLERFSDAPEAQAALAALRQRSERLPENELAWLEAHAPPRAS